MRSAFVQALAELAGRDPRILLLTADLGYTVLEPFAAKYPERFFNVGVAEQNMIGLATGLAESGYLVFVYSMVPFAVLRPYEFIRNGPIQHQLPVRIVGVGGGVDYGLDGLSHYGIEDVGVLRTQPGISIVAPADREQARTALEATWDLPRPVYYRLGKSGTPVVPGLGGRFELGRAQVIREGRDLLIVAMGTVAEEAAAAAEMLAARGVSSTVAVVASLNPAPAGDLAALLRRFPVALTVEAHYVVGGVGSLVCEVAAERGIPCRVVRCGIEATPSRVVGSRDYLLRAHGLSRTKLAEAAMEALTGMPRIAF